MVKSNAKGKGAGKGGGGPAKAPAEQPLRTSKGNFAFTLVADGLYIEHQVRGTARRPCWGVHERRRALARAARCMTRVVHTPRVCSPVGQEQRAHWPADRGHSQVYREAPDVHEGQARGAPRQMR
eukprot:2861744-Prymnesium_polylepis.1